VKFTFAHFPPWFCQCLSFQSIPPWNVFTVRELASHLYIHKSLWYKFFQFERYLNDGLVFYYEMWNVWDIHSYQISRILLRYTYIISQEYHDVRNKGVSGMKNSQQLRYFSWLMFGIKLNALQPQGENGARITNRGSRISYSTLIYNSTANEPWTKLQYKTPD
jgi:hypothetical protein